MYAALALYQCLFVGAGAGTQGQTSLQLSASLGELAIFVSGRTTEIWWPPEVPSPFPQHVLLAIVLPDSFANLTSKGAVLCYTVARLLQLDQQDGLDAGFTFQLLCSSFARHPYLEISVNA